MKNKLLITSMVLMPFIAVLFGCVGENTGATISAAYNGGTAESASCAILESGSYCNINITVQNNQTGAPLFIAFTSDQNNVNAGLPAGFAVTSTFANCAQAMNSNITKAQTCPANIQYTGGNPGRTGYVYYMLCTGNSCSSTGNPVATSNGIAFGSAAN